MKSKVKLLLDFAKGENPANKKMRIYWGSRNSVGIAIQLSDSEQEKLFVHDSMQVSPE